MNLNISSKKILSFAFLVGSFSLFNGSAKAATFNDVPTENPAYTAVEYLNEEGIFKGYPDGLFGITQNMNRAELMAVVSRMVGVEPDAEENQNCFIDVKKEWFAPYVCYAKLRGWVQGYEDGMFRPEQLVTEHETLKMVLRPLFSKEIFAQTKEEIDQIIQKEPYLYPEDQGTWYIPYFAFAYARNLDVGLKEIDNDYMEELIKNVGGDTISHDIKRGNVAQLMFRALLMKENKWEFYDDYLRDELFLGAQKENFLSQSYPCYPLSESAPDFILNHIKNEFGTDILEEMTYLDEDRPYSIISKFCLLKNGDYLLAGSNTTDDKTNQHLITFDKEGTFLKDDNVPCEENILDLLGEPPRLPSKFDPNTFELIDCIYSKDAANVYGLGDIFDEADPNTFEVLNFPYSKDAQHVYMGPTYMEEADPKTFHVFDSTLLDFEFALYAKDATQVYYFGRKVVDADPSTFEVSEPLKLPTQWTETSQDLLSGIFYYLMEREFAKDKNRWYMGGREISGVDHDTFEPIDLFYAKDKNNVYAFDESYYPGSDELPIVEKADSATFVSLDSPYGKDADGLYYFGKLMEGADPDSAVLIENPTETTEFWLKTNDALYIDDQRITGIADPASFELIDENYGKDKENVYFLEEKYSEITDEISFPILPEADPATFTRFESPENIETYEVYRDANHLFFEGAVLKTLTLDLTTVKWLDEDTFKDAKNFSCDINDNSAYYIRCSQK